jgi:hypothetical protein
MYRSNFAHMNISLDSKLNVLYAFAAWLLLLLYLRLRSTLPYKAFGRNGTPCKLTKLNIALQPAMNRYALVLCLRMGEGCGGR